MDSHAMLDKSNEFISVGIILAGAFVAGAWDLGSDAYSYAIIFLANIITAVYFSSIAQIGNSFTFSFHSSFMIGSIQLLNH